MECIVCDKDRKETEGQFDDYENFCCKFCIDAGTAVKCDCGRFMNHEESIGMNQPDVCNVCRDEYAAS